MWPSFTSLSVSPCRVGGCRPRSEIHTFCRIIAFPDFVSSNTVHWFFTHNPRLESFLSVSPQQQRPTPNTARAFWRFLSVCPVWWRRRRSCFGVGGDKETPFLPPCLAPTRNHEKWIIVARYPAWGRQLSRKIADGRRTEPNPSQREWGTAQQTPPSSIVSITCTTHERVPPQSAAAVAPRKKTVILSFLYFSFWQRLRWQREKEVLDFLFLKRCCCTLSRLAKKSSRKLQGFSYYCISLFLRSFAKMWNSYFRFFLKASTENSTRLIIRSIDLFSHVFNIRQKSIVAMLLIEEPRPFSFT